MKLSEYTEGTPLQFREESRGHRSGEDYLSLYAYSGNELVGKVDYGIFRDDIFIQMIKVIKDSDKRKGIATALAKELQRLYPEAEINWGMTTKQGGYFIEKLPRTFIPNKRYEELTDKLTMLKLKRDKLQAIYDQWSNLYDTDREKAELLRPKIVQLHEPFNQNSSDIWDVEQELSSLAPGRWKINI